MRNEVESMFVDINDILSTPGDIENPQVDNNYELIPQLDRGQVILSIVGEFYVFNAIPTKEQLKRFENDISFIM